MREAGDNSTYLGLPNMLGRNKASLLVFLKDKVNKRVQSWDGCRISQAGKEVLVKSVAQTLHSYAMSVFLLPMEIIKDMERNISKFWLRSGNEDAKRIHWMS